MILAQAGVSYEDYRLPREDWPSMKPSTNYKNHILAQYYIEYIHFKTKFKIILDTITGTLPILEYNGTTISQSITIARFLAKEFNLAGKNRIEEAQADMIVDCVADLLNGKFSVPKMRKSYSLENKIFIDFIAASQILIKEKDENRKAEMMKTFQTEAIPNAIKMFEKLLSANGGKFFVGKEVVLLTYAFLSLFILDF